jgi:hypothetical protein
MKPASLKEGAESGNVFLIADVDAFYDRFAYNVQQLRRHADGLAGQRQRLAALQPARPGGRLEAPHRLALALRHPPALHRGPEMEAEFNKQVGTKIEEFQEKQRAAQEKLNELQAQKSRGSELYPLPRTGSGNPQTAQGTGRILQAHPRAGKRSAPPERQTRRQRITLLNVAVMPAIVILIGLGLFIQRRRSTRAR